MSKKKVLAASRPPLSVEKRTQSEDRIVCENKDALIIDLVMKDTVDIDILNALKAHEINSARTLNDVLGDAMFKRRKLKNAVHK